MPAVRGSISKQFPLIFCICVNYSLLEPIGPLALEGMDAKQRSFFFNSTEIHLVNCPETPDLFVFAFCSEQGELFHALLSLVTPLKKLFEEGKNVYRLTVMDSMQIEDWPLNNINVVLRKSEYSS